MNIPPPSQNRTRVACEARGAQRSAASASGTCVTHVCVMYAHHHVTTPTWGTRTAPPFSSSGHTTSCLPLLRGSLCLRWLFHPLLCRVRCGTEFFAASLCCVTWLCCTASAGSSSLGTGVLSRGGRLALISVWVSFRSMFPATRRSSQHLRVARRLRRLSWSLRRIT